MHPDSSEETSSRLSILAQLFFGGGKVFTAAESCKDEGEEAGAPAHPQAVTSWQLWFLSCCFSRAVVCVLRCSSPTAQGQAGNAVQYITRNQALKKLQLKLSEFRWRLHAGHCFRLSRALLHTCTRCMQSKQPECEPPCKYAGGCAS